MRKNQLEAEFISSVMEAYKVKHGRSGKEVAMEFSQTGALDFLMQGYDVLHTQSLAYVVEDVEAFMRGRDVR